MGKTWQRPSDSYMCSVHTMFRQIGLDSWDGGETEAIELWAKEEEGSVAQSRGRFGVEDCSYTPRCGRP